MARKKSSDQGKKRVNPEGVMGLHAEVLEQPITDTLEINYMPYAMSVIISRAIPEIDGFKPSHRKLLYTMYQMKLLTGGRTKSRQRGGGQTMKLNPHGDACHLRDHGPPLPGVWGSAPPAWWTPRATSARSTPGTWPTPPPGTPRSSWTPICEELFRDIDQDAVDFVPNYDGTLTEPALLPTTFPNILVSRQHGHCRGHGLQPLRLQPRRGL